MKTKPKTTDNLPATLPDVAISQQPKAKPVAEMQQAKARQKQKMQWAQRITKSWKEGMKGKDLTVENDSGAEDDTDAEDDGGNGSGRYNPHPSSKGSKSDADPRPPEPREVVLAGRNLDAALDLYDCSNEAAKFNVSGAVDRAVGEKLAHCLPSQRAAILAGLQFAAEWADELEVLVNPQADAA